MTLSELKPGDVLTFWHDSGAMGAQLCFARVERTGTKMVRVRDERGVDAWKHTHYFDRRLSDAEAADLRAEGVKV